jgi:lysine 2,3-aminomutase
MENDECNNSQDVIKNGSVSSQSHSENTLLKPRGRAMMLPHGGLPEAIPPYLRELIRNTGGIDGPIGKQFIARPKLELANAVHGMVDPLNEDEEEVAPGLIYKYRAGEDEQGRYPGRALFTIARNCAAYCRFCTRGRKVGIPANMASPLKGALSRTAHLSIAQIDESLEYLANRPEINEVILSGGDPLMAKPTLLKYTLDRLGRLQRSGDLDIVRVSTRLPIQNPRLMKEGHFEAISELILPRIMLHINHPTELTHEAVGTLNRFRSDCGAIIMSQTVLLKGVNDDVDTLTSLFNKLVTLGIIPYYVSQNDPVYWAEHFTVEIDRAIEIWQMMRPRLSGLAATARFVIDAPGGYGKVTVPEGGAWEINFTRGYRDHQGRRFKLY